VATAIRAGKFWPPNEKIAPEFDDFAALFHHGVAESVAWKGAGLATEVSGIKPDLQGGGAA
jgi:hypothetical protein